MLDKNKTILMTKLAMYDKRLGKKDKKTVSYFRHDYIYLKNMWTRLCVSIGFVIIMFFYAVYRIYSEGFDLLVSNLRFEAANIIVLFLCLMVFYTIIGTIRGTAEYAAAENRLKKYFMYLDNLNKIDNTDTPSAPGEFNDYADYDDYGDYDNYENNDGKAGDEAEKKRALLFKRPERVVLPADEIYNPEYIERERFVYEPPEDLSQDELEKQERIKEKFKQYKMEKLEMFQQDQELSDRLYNEKMEQAKRYRREFLDSLKYSPDKELEQNRLGQNGSGKEVSHNGYATYDEAEDN